MKSVQGRVQMSQLDGEAWREQWWALCGCVRGLHVNALGESPRLISQDDGYVVPRAFMLDADLSYEERPYPSVGRGAVMETLVRSARAREATAIATLFQGVSIEEEAHRYYWRPAILTILFGIGALHGWVYEISQRVNVTETGLELCGPVSRQRRPDTPECEWVVEIGPELLAQGPWPRLIPVVG